MYVQLVMLVLLLLQESSSLMGSLSGKMRRLVSQSLYKEISCCSNLLLQLSRFVLMLFSGDSLAHSRLQPLAMESIRSAAINSSND